MLSESFYLAMATRIRPTEATIMAAAEPARLSWSAWDSALMLAIAARGSTLVVSATLGSSLTIAAPRMMTA